MEPTTEAPVAGQIIEQAEVDKMTPAQISERLDTDLDFAIAITEGRLTVPEPAAGPAPAPAAEPPKAEASKPGGTAPAAAAPAAPAAPEKEFTVKESELGPYKTVGELLKGKREADGTLSIRNQQLASLESQQASQQGLISDLSQKLKDAEDKLRAAKTPPAAPAAGDDKGEEDLYDPESLKKIKAKADRVDQLEADLTEMKASLKATGDEIGQIRRKGAMSAQFADLAAFQERATELKTAKPLEVINEEYKVFLRDLGTMTGTNGTSEANMQVAQIFLNDTSERGEKLRKDAETRGVKLPAEYDKYATLLTLRGMKSSHFRRIGDKEEPLTYDELYPMSGLKGSIQAPAASAAPAAPAPAQPPAPKPGEGMEAALAARNAAARSVPAGEAGGGPENMSDADKSALLDTPIEELRRNPGKLKLYNSIMVGLGQEPIDPFQTS